MRRLPLKDVQSREHQLKVRKNPDFSTEPDPASLNCFENQFGSRNFETEGYVLDPSLPRYTRIPPFQPHSKHILGVMSPSSQAFNSAETERDESYGKRLQEGA